MRKIIIHIVCLFALLRCSPNQSELSQEANFKNPPASCKPLPWMHDFSGNMSKVSLTKDLESIAEVGIGGVLLFNPGLSKQKILTVNKLLVRFWKPCSPLY